MDHDASNASQSLSRRLDGVLTALTEAAARRHAGLSPEAPTDRGHMSLRRVCPRCHAPMRAVQASVEEDRITGLPVTRHAYRCDHCG